MPPSVPPALRPELLAWYDQNKRDLPWRHTRDPYAIWLSEVMLQQTQVDRVLEYWQRFLTALPTGEALAAARLEDVLSLWRGLGYYSRARNLHRAAGEIVKRFGGKLPGTAEQLSTLHDRLIAALDPDLRPDDAERFRPHLTFSRPRKRLAAGQFEALQAQARPWSWQFEVDALHLVSSEMLAGGARYAVVASSGLGG